MNDSIDKRSRLETELFSYHANKDGKVFIFWEGRQLKVLKEKAARRFLEAAAGATPLEIQLMLAKITGNFKRGNER